MAGFEKDFIKAVREGGETRRRAFDFWEERHGKRFGEGEKGYKFYCDLLEVVRKAGDPEAVKEYQKRFVPLCDQEFVGKLVMGTFTQALDKRVNELDEAERAELEELRRKQNEAKKGFFRKLFG
jgi:hypothetical protein